MLNPRKDSDGVDAHAFSNSYAIHQESVVETFLGL